MKKVFTKALSLALVMGLALSVAACGETKQPAASQASGAKSSETVKSEAPAASGQSDKKEEKTGLRKFTDSVGREVELPKVLNKVAPSGPLAQVVLYTAYPDKLAGLAKKFGQSQLKYFPEKYHSLPEFGQFYGKNTSLNLEALLAAKPDAIIDIGEPKKTVKEDMDKLQSELKIPTVFVEAKLTDMGAAYKKLAELFGEPGKTAELAKYCEDALALAKKVSSELKPEQKVPVYWAMGDKGLNTNAEKSFQSEVLQVVGADNVAKVKAVSRGGGTEVSFEQLLQWKPKYILVDNAKLLETIQKDSTWQDYLQKSGAKLVVIPSEPYGLLANPPSVNRILGIYWLGQTLYPDLYKRDLKKDFRDFYKLFYSVDLTAEQAAKLLGE